MKNKEDAFTYYMRIIKQSWTYDKLTDEERARIDRVFNSIQTTDALKGTFDARIKTLNAIYYGYLMALNYNPIDWREEGQHGRD